jgi:2-polyprenyl-3-methyl-5-hydroxy-6-metoxy-1,4-benzoquinol methylase
MGSKNINKASSYWDENVKLHEKPKVVVSWLDLPLMQDHCLKKLKVGVKVMSVTQWVLWVKEKYLPSTTLDYGLSLGCGDGTLERHAISFNICSRFDAYDISSKSIEVAKKHSEEGGFSDRINYQVADLNNIILPSNKYDIIFAGMSIHHIYNLEHIFVALEKSLKPNGLFVMIEFVGPSQFQWTNKQLHIINNILEILPKRLKIDVRSKTVKEQCLRPSVEYMNEHDPSEAIRSSDIIPLVYKMWNVEERIDFGGTISHMLLDGIVANFDPAKEEDIAILRLMQYMEDTLIKEKVLPSDFTLIVAKKSSISKECEYTKERK